MNFGMVMGGTLAVSFLDEEINDYLQRHRSATVDRLSDIGVTYGEPLTVVALTGVVYVVGLSTGWERLRESAVILSGTLLPTGAVQTVTKRLSGRARPHLGLGHDVFDPFRNEEAYYSFFSGHVMVAMATSHVFAKQFPHPVSKTIFYGLGGLAGFARLYEEDHWLSDVVLGSVVAIVSVNSVAKWLAQQQPARAGGARAPGGAQWRLFARGRGLGLEVRW